jgi:oxygen-independent coproporphyrinogen-3 oxidase
MRDLINTACYIHIPFCDHKCIYCDFYSIIKLENVDRFLSALKKEIQFYSEKYSESRKLISIYFGGGTPSLMNPEYLREIISFIKSEFKVDEKAEITMETNPGTVNKEKLIAFRTAGINRISIGIQSLNNDELKFLTRIHNSETAVETVNAAKLAGFENISIDLIFNLPGQTKEKWLHNLNKAVELPIDHISAYSLILERGTILNKMVLDKKVIMQDDDYDADLYETTIDFLTNRGFYQYEVSNFTKPGYECLHNNVYWKHGEYFGFGTSAHSFINKKRWWNLSSAKMYIDEVEINRNAVAGSELISEGEAFEEYLMLALRGSGIIIDELSKKYNGDWLIKNSSYFENLSKEGYVNINQNRIWLTKKGYAVCDEIIKNLS